MSSTPLTHSISRFANQGSDIHCQEITAKFGKGYQPCDRLLVRGGLIRCKCKSGHSLIDLVASSAERDAKRLSVILARIKRQFWNNKANDSMNRYWVARQLGNRLATPLPEWILNRIDLVDGGFFRPVQLFNHWMLIEYDPLRNEYAWGTGDIDRLCEAEYVQKYVDQTRQRLQLSASMLDLPDHPQTVMHIRDFRQWLWADEGYRGQSLGLGGQHWVHDAWLKHYDASTNVASRPNPDDQATYEFVIQG